MIFSMLNHAFKSVMERCNFVALQIVRLTRGQSTGLLNYDNHKKNDFDLHMVIFLDYLYLLVSNS